MSARNLVKRFGTVEAVRGVSFDILQGECLGLLGPNGAGKTTTIEMLENILPPSSGDIRFRDMPLAQIAAQFRAEAGIAFQHTALQDHLSVHDNLRLFSKLFDAPMDTETLIELCALQPLLTRDARKLSGGQRQRLLLALALVNDPKIVFLDEPTTGLDPQARRNFWELVRRIKAQGTTVLLTTHYMDEAFQLCDRLAIMDHGQIIAEGTPAELLATTFAERVVELPPEDFPPGASGVPEPRMTNGHCEWLTDDLDVLIDQLRAAGVSLARLRVRDRTLEDLFIHLTGAELRA